MVAAASLPARVRLAQTPCRRCADAQSRRRRRKLGMRGSAKRPSRSCVEVRSRSEHWRLRLREFPLHESAAGRTLGRSQRQLVRGRGEASNLVDVHESSFVAAVREPERRGRVEFQRPSGPHGRGGLFVPGRRPLRRLAFGPQSRPWGERARRHGRASAVSSRARPPSGGRRGRRRKPRRVLDERAKAYRSPPSALPAGRPHVRGFYLERDELPEAKSHSRLWA